MRTMDSQEHITSACMQCEGMERKECQNRDGLKLKTMEGNECLNSCNT